MCKRHPSLLITIYTIALVFMRVFASCAPKILFVNHEKNNEDPQEMLNRVRRCVNNFLARYNNQNLKRNNYSYRKTSAGDTAVNSFYTKLSIIR